MSKILFISGHIGGEYLCECIQQFFINHGRSDVIITSCKTAQEVIQSLDDQEVAAVISGVTIPPGEELPVEDRNVPYGFFLAAQAKQRRPDLAVFICTVRKLREFTIDLPEFEKQGVVVYSITDNGVSGFVLLLEESIPAS